MSVTAAIAVLWLALAPEKFPLQADTLSCAAGTAGKQKWSLILPSSARVSELTYVTIVGTRYPELDTFQTPWVFAHLLGCSTAIFMPVLTLERWWTGSRVNSWWQRKGTSTLQCCITVTKWWTPLPPQMGCWFRRRCSLTQCNFLRWNDCLSCFAGANQSGIPQWGTWENFPSAHPTGAGCPERRSFCKSNGGPYQSPADMHNHGSLGHAWSGWGQQPLWAAWNMGPASTGQMWFRLPGWNWALLRRILL